jgi:hypothetical protein
MNHQQHTLPSTIHPEQNTKKKIISFIAFSLFVCAAACMVFAFAVTNANGQFSTPASVTTITPPPIELGTGIKGTIKVPGPAANGPFVGFACANLVVYADSKKQNSNTYTSTEDGKTTSITINTPKWENPAHAGGTYSSGTCSYYLAVPASPHEFTMRVGVDFIPKTYCDYMEATTTGLSGTHLWTVPKGTWKTNDFTVTELKCEVIK